MKIMQTVTWYRQISIIWNFVENWIANAFAVKIKGHIAPKGLKVGCTNDN